MAELRFTVDDRTFLKKMRISPDDLCVVCKGDGCHDCHQTGWQKPAAAPLNEPDTDDSA